MRAETDKAQNVAIGFLIDQDEIRAKVAVSEIRPGATQGVVVIVGGEWDVVGQGGHDGARRSSRRLPWRPRDSRL